MDEVHVLMVVLGLGTGGAERSTVDLAPHLAEHGVRLHIHSRGRRPVGAESDLPVGLEVTYTPDPRPLPWLRSVRRAITGSRVDVVHTVLFEADLVGRLAAAGSGVPVLTSLVNTSYDPARRSDPAIRRWRLEVARSVEVVGGRFLTQAFHALTPSVADAARDHLKVSPSRLTVVPRGRDVTRLGSPSDTRRVAARASLGIEDDRPVLLHVGRQEFQKAHDTLIGAFEALRRQQPDAVLVMAGRPGNATSALEDQLEKADLGASLIRPGHVDDVASLFCAADVFVFPSRFEGQGGVLIEAMALGCPIVASDIGPIRDTVGRDAAVLVTPDRPEEFADAVNALLADGPRRAAMGRAGRDRFAENFSIDTVAAQMSALYRSVAEAGRR